MKLFKWILNLFRPTFTTGALPQPKDNRDLKFKEHFTVGSIPSNNIPDLSKWGKLPNQYQMHSCVGFAIARGIEVLIYQIVKEETGDDYYMNVSEYFTWYLARLKQGWEEENVGTYPRDAFKQLFKHGYLKLEDFPYTNRPVNHPNQYDYNIAKTARDMLVAMKFKYYQTTRSEAIKLSNKGTGVHVSLPINNSWNKTFSKDINPNNQGYHYMYLEGTITKNNIEYCKLANSWGKGYLYVPKTYFMKYARDLWVLAKK